MKSNIAKPISIILTTICSFFPSLSVFADQCSANVCSGNYPDSVKAACGCKNNSGNLADTIVNILDVIIGVAGIVAVIFIIVGGVTYMTSTGDPGKIKKAKDTILYSVIGLIICALAFAIVNFVILGILKKA